MMVQLFLKTEKALLRGTWPSQTLEIQMIERTYSSSTYGISVRIHTHA